MRHIGTASSLRTVYSSVAVGGTYCTNTIHSKHKVEKPSEELKNGLFFLEGEFLFFPKWKNKSYSRFHVDLRQ